MQAPTFDRLIVTAASAEFGPSLLALIGSLNLNWPGHPPVLVYDIGLDARTLAILAHHGIVVRTVPAFCAHWRKHFTWKIWALNDAPTRDVFWLDAGVVALQPLDEVFEAIDRLGYFFTTNYELLDWEASEQACRGCGVTPDFRTGKLTLLGGMMGFRKAGQTGTVLEKALAAALVEANVAATNVAHRHDQAIISLLAYRHLGSVVIADGAVYLGWLSPEQVPGQKAWVHRRRIRPDDVHRLAAHLSRGGAPHRPLPPHPLSRARALGELYRVYWCYGRGQQAEAARRLEASFALEPGLRDELPLLARLLRGHAGRLQGFSSDPEEGARYLAWVGSVVRAIAGPDGAARLEAELRAPDVAPTVAPTATAPA
jgi:hypothetical protein